MRCSAPSPCGSSLVREPGAPDGYELALVSTDLDSTPAELVERYADRWSVEVLFEESRQVAGVGQARNRTHRARAPWYRTKHTVSLADMLNALRRELLPAEFLSSHLVTSTLEEFLHAQAAGAADAA